MASGDLHQTLIIAGITSMNVRKSRIILSAAVFRSFLTHHMHVCLMFASFYNSFSNPLVGLQFSICKSPPHIRFDVSHC